MRPRLVALRVGRRAGGRAPTVIRVARPARAVRILLPARRSAMPEDLGGSRWDRDAARSGADRDRGRGRPRGELVTRSGTKEVRVSGRRLRTLRSLQRSPEGNKRHIYWLKRPNHAVSKTVT